MIGLEELHRLQEKRAELQGRVARWRFQRRRVGRISVRERWDRRIAEAESEIAEIDRKLEKGWEER